MTSSEAITIALAELTEATARHAELYELARAASREETEACNRVNRAQKAFDDLVAGMKKTAPVFSDWRKTNGVEV